MKKLIILFNVLFLVSTLCGKGLADDNVKSHKTLLADKFSLAEIVALAYENNPKIKAYKSSWEAAIEKYPRAVSLEDPMFKAGYFIENVETRVGPQEFRYMLTQKFPYPGTLAVKGEIVRIDSEIGREKFEKEVKNIIVGIKINYFELLYLNESISITSQNEELLRYILKNAATRYAKELSTLNDVLKAEAQLAQLTYDVITLRELKEVVKGRIISLVGLPTDTIIGEPETMELEILNLKTDELYELALSKRQEIRLAGLKFKKLKKKVKLIEKMNKPMFSLGISYIQTGKTAMSNVPDSGKDPVLVEFGFSIPLWAKKNSAKRLEANLHANAARQEKINIENITMSMIKEIYFKLENSKRLIKLYSGSLIPQAARAMELAENLSSEKIESLSGFLETQSIWLNFNLAYQRSIADYRQHLTRLEKIVGGDLQ